MEFSGERYLPSEAGQIRHEHMHRYAWCRRVVEGKIVLDIACGEGYGSAMLAVGAAKVIGVDIAEEMVAHAASTYADQRNLEFKQGDAAAIPLPDASVDVVVSFETIEHHDRHREMLSEVRRVLRADGLMIMSSPNREIYAELAGYHNEFHVKELDFDEFDQLLREQFAQVRYFGQRLAVGSSIFSLVGGSADKIITPFTDTGDEIVQRPASLTDPVYFVGVAGAISPEVERKLRASVLFSEAEDLYVHHREVATWAKSLDHKLVELSEKYAKSVADGQAVSEWAHSLAQETQAQVDATRIVTEAWEEEQRVRIAAEQMAQDQSKAVREATEAWQAEQKVRIAAEQMAQDQSKAAREATEAWHAEQKVRIAAEQMVQDQAKAVGEAIEARQAEQKVRITTEQEARDQTEAARKATKAWHEEQKLRMEMDQVTQAQTEAVREMAAGWRAEQQARMAAEQLAQDHAEAARKATLAWQEEQKTRLATEHAARDQVVAATGEIVKRDARIHMLERELEELRLIKASRSWRWTRPFRFVLRIIRQPKPPAQCVNAPNLLAEGNLSTSAAALGPAVRLGHSSVAQLALAGQEGWRHDFFVWAVIDWHFRIQRPQHLARELAATGHRVFYISNNFVDSPEPGFVVESLGDEGRLFQVNLHLLGSPAIYHAAPNVVQQAQLRASTGLLLEWTRSRACASLVQHPYWLETAQVLPNHRMVYDCMDHHGGFADNTDAVLERERELMRDADLLVVTSDWLYEEVGKENPQRMMIRNACQYEHFAAPSQNVFKDSKARKVIGYYGAIAEWFDLDLLVKVARRFSDCLVLLVGADTCGARERLKELDNVQLTGEVPYATLPYYLDGFDVCLLPFRVIPLTLATNPVKIYEYLSAGKEVVSIELPEIRQFGDLVRTGNNHAAFLDAVDAALNAKPDQDMIARRRKFAAGQTWAHRVEDLVHGIETVPQPRVSVVVVTYNNLEHTQACLDSLNLYSNYANLEIIVVDNASADETPAYLKQWVASDTQRHIILNDDNRGFAAANNQGLALATGDYLVMLNNDTYVTPGWIATLVRHLRRNEELGMLGPVTNNIGNEARININYASMDEMLQVAGEYTAKHAGQLTPLRTAAFFCVMLRRSIFEKVGYLDEIFGIGFFEDDDYCRRVEQAGWSIACADDVFIHHNLSASFNKLKHETRQALFEANKTAYEAKWGEWVPHSYRTNF